MRFSVAYAASRHPGTRTGSGIACDAAAACARRPGAEVRMKRRTFQSVALEKRASGPSVAVAAAVGFVLVDAERREVTYRDSARAAWRRRIEEKKSTMRRVKRRPERTRTARVGGGRVVTVNSAVVGEGRRTWRRGVVASIVKFG